MNSSDSEYETTENENIDFDDSNEIFRLIITTDNHLGFMEKDPERGQDSFISFEEALEISKEEQVDFILLGGDLFHENKPSRDCLTKCQKLLREHCFGEKPIEFEIISDENMNFGHTGFPRANFNDPNLNVSIPVFSIHGNHDDPTGQQNLCVLDTLAAAGLVNYFGKSNTSCDQGIDIVPVLLEKGPTKLAIYGLGAIKDERLHNMFEKGLVQFVRPSEDKDEWFNIFVIHQNRSAHGKKNYIPEGFLPDFIDLVIWGHEHECRIRPEFNELQRFYVSQPGSSVITSLSESELAPKHIALLKVFKKNFKLEPIPLRSVRQFMMDTVVLADCNLNPTDKNIEIKIENLLAKKVEKLVEECNKNRYYYEKQPIKPLIRLKVDHTDFESINENRFAQKMLDKVANPRNILQFFKKQVVKKEEASLDVEAAKILRMHGGGEQLEYLKVQDLVGKYFKKADEKNKMIALTEKGLSDAIKEYIEKDEKDAIAELINFQINRLQTYLKKEVKWQNEFQLDQEIKKFQHMRICNQDEEDQEIKDIFEKTRKNTQSSQRSNFNQYESEEEIVQKKKANNNDSDDEIFQDNDEIGVDLVSKRGGRGRGSRGGGTRARGRGSRGGRGGRGAKSVVVEEEKYSEMFPSSSRSQVSSSAKPVKKPTYTLDDSDPDVIDVEEETSKTKSSYKSTNQPVKTLSTTPSVRRTRIEYDEDDEDNDFGINYSSKKVKVNNSKISNDNDENEITNTFSIFKKMANKKKL